jgi:NADPH:quinone reductase-like Zn-dependent oxidoreductase
VGILTVSLALYQKLGLPFPGEGKSDEWVLIYGGSTATGSLAIQYAKLYVDEDISTTFKGRLANISTQVRMQGHYHLQPP